MIAELIAWAVVAMAIMIVVPLSIALGIWTHNRLQELRKGINRRSRNEYELDRETFREHQRRLDETFNADLPNSKKGDNK